MAGPVEAVCEASPSFDFDFDFDVGFALAAAAVAAVDGDLGRVPVFVEVTLAGDPQAAARIGRRRSGRRIGVRNTVG